MKGKELKILARSLRRNQTDTEKKLWGFLRSRQFKGFKFRRQQPVDRYVADFCCLEKKLVIELDGGQHGGRQDQDAERTRFLEGKGFKVIRVWDNEVFENLEVVLELIRQRLEGSPSPRPSPLKGEGDAVQAFNIPH